MKRLAIVTSEENSQLAKDDRLLISPLARWGVEAVPLVWSRDNFEPFDAILIRSPWDYHLHWDEYSTWQRSRTKAGARFFNHTRLIEWNVHKRYLMELRARGFPVVETLLATGTSFDHVLEGAREKGWQQLVFKPAISASAFETRIVDPKKEDEVEWARALANRRDTLVQPFLGQIRTLGELSLIVIAGEVTHALLKRPAAGDFRTQEEFGAVIHTVPVDSAHRSWAKAFMDAAKELSNSPEEALYARVDLVPSDSGKWILGELELFEPSLALQLNPLAADRLAERLALELVGASPKPVGKLYERSDD